MMTNKKQNKGPVFIVGMNGSGTTMLLDHLNNHSELYGFPIETRVLPYFITSLNAYGDLHNDKNFMRLWNDIRCSFPFRKANNNMSVPLPDNWRDIPREVGKVFDQVIKYFALKEGKSRWCEKSPMYVLHMVELSKSFPDARFIHIVRDGRDNAASFHRRWRKHPNRTILRWKQVVRDGRLQGSMLGEKYLEVSYEEITHDPETELKRICKFISVPFERNILISSRCRYSPKIEDKVSEDIVNNSGKYKKYFGEKQLGTLEQIAGSTLAEFGYKTDHPNLNKEPSFLLQRAWAIHDGIWFILMEIRSKWQQGKRRPWNMVSSRIKASLQQRFTSKY